MKKSLLSIAAVVALSTLSSVGVAHAEPQVIGGSGANNDSVQVSAKARALATYDMTYDDFSEYENHYRLSTGGVMKFTQSSFHYFGEVKGHTVEMFPVAQGVFVTRSGARIAFSDEGQKVTIIGAENLPRLLGALPTGTIMTAQR